MGSHKEVEQSKRVFFGNIAYHLTNPKEILLSLFSTKRGYMFIIGVFILPLLIPFISYGFVFNFFILLLFIIGIFMFLGYIYSDNQSLNLDSRHDKVSTSTFILSSIMLLPFITKRGYLLIIGIFILPSLLPFISYSFIFKWLLLHLFIIAILKVFQYIYSDNRYLIWESKQSPVIELVKILLLLPFTLLNWVGIFTLLVISYFSIILSILFVFYIMALIAIDIYNNKNHLKRELTNISLYVRNKKCDICAQSLRKINYFKVPIGGGNNGAGYVCKSCEMSYSPFLQASFHTLGEVKEHLAYRTSNLSQDFSPEHEFRTINWINNYVDTYSISSRLDPTFLFDFKNHTMVIDGWNYSPYVNSKPDRIYLKDIVECELDIKIFESEVTNVTEEDYHEALRNQTIARIPKLKDTVGDYRLGGVSFSYNGELNDAIIKASEYDSVHAPSFKINEPDEYNQRGDISGFVDTSESPYIKKYHLFYIRLKINHEYFSTIDVRLNAQPLYFNEPEAHYDSYKSIGEEICKYINDYTFT